MKKGEHVMIFEDPITEHHEEGPAILIEQLSVERSKVDQIERWRVKMLPDMDIVERDIRVVLD